MFSQTSVNIEQFDRYPALINMVTTALILLIATSTLGKETVNSRLVGTWTNAHTRYNAQVKLSLHQDGQFYFVQTLGSQTKYIAPLYRRGRWTIQDKQIRLVAKQEFFDGDPFAHVKGIKASKWDCTFNIMPNAILSNSKSDNIWHSGQLKKISSKQETFDWTNKANWQTKNNKEQF